MSGGSRNYAYCYIENDLCGSMYDAELDDLMKDVAKLAHDVEWYDSGDIGLDNYMKTVQWFKEKWFGSDREERLKGYIDTELENMRDRMYSLIGVKGSETDAR